MHYHKALCVLVLAVLAHACGNSGQNGTSLMRGVEGTAPAQDGGAGPCGSKELIAVTGECIPARPNLLQAAQLVVDAICIGAELSSKCEANAFTNSYKGVEPGAKVAHGILAHVQAHGAGDAETLIVLRTAEANLAVFDALLGNVADAIRRLDEAAQQTDFETRTHEDVVVCQFRASETTNYPLYLVQPYTPGVKSLARMVPASEPSVLFRDGSLCHLLGPVEPTFALSKGAKSSDGRFLAAQKAGFAFFSGEGGSMFMVEQRRPSRRTGKLRWYMDANLSILMLTRTLRDANR